MNEDMRNMLLAIAISLALVFAVQTFMPQLFPSMQPEPAPERPAEVAGSGNGESGGLTVTGSDGQNVSAITTRDDALDLSDRIEIDTGVVTGSLNLRGAVLDDLTLTQYRETLDDNSPNVDLLHPQDARGGYTVAHDWLTSGGRGLIGKANWTVESGNMLTVDTPVVLSIETDSGITVRRTIQVAGDYLFRITDELTHSGSEALTLAPFGSVNRFDEVADDRYTTTGYISVLDRKLREHKYGKIAKPSTNPEERLNPTSGEQGGIVTTGGWVGFTDKYWMVALVPSQTDEVRAGYALQKGGLGQRQFVSSQYTYNSSVTVQPQQSVEVSTLVFAGAKEVDLLDAYAKEFSIPKFDRGVNFWFIYPLTKPLFIALAKVTDWLRPSMGPYAFGAAIIVLTLIVKTLLFPLQLRAYRSMAKMRTLQPKMKELQEKHADDRPALSQAMMTLYREEGVNPLGGCLPMLLQFPVFISLYRVMLVTLEARHAPFPGWIQDLSAKDPTGLLELFGLIPWNPEMLPLIAILNIGIWPIVYGLSMLALQRMSPAPSDPMQARIFLFMPIIFTFVLAGFPVGLVIYWTVNNIISMGQQFIIGRMTKTKSQEQQEAAAARAEAKAAAKAEKKAKKEQGGA
jgi:YidC/Oxa1 family membrane protein insertase